ncbi:hypothetical protein PEPS_26440 [Persicobacter psychrovividus]|uniref:Uncharacterized protein n=1 Tax=Persicobacter psychrovividus TaxID=387638 RepID=A0ABN6LB17_9BACT|nr:hypothetical protein PEPS_26440 [Persicobacter psychrovividus]
MVFDIKLILGKFILKKNLSPDFIDLSYKSAKYQAI